MTARRWMLAGLLGVLAVPNYLMWHHAQRETQGIEAFLELAPVDPRSLMQGDYMRLNYSLSRSIDGSSKRGKIVVHLDERRVLRGDAPLTEVTPPSAPLKGETGALKPGELALSYYSDQGRPTVGPTSYMFPEGQAAVFQRAKYARIRLLPEGDTVLLGLVGADLQELRPGSSASPQPAEGKPATIPQEYLVQRDGKPPLSCLARLQLKQGLTIAPEGVFLLQPGELRCLRWDSIQLIRVTDGSIFIFARAIENPDQAFSEDLLLDAPYGSPEIARQLVVAAGLSLDSRSDGHSKNYRRKGKKPQPPPRASSFPAQKQLPALEMPLSDIARLPKPLGVFFTSTGLAVAEPYGVSSISWKNCRHIDFRDAERDSYSRDNCRIYLSSTENGTSADSEAIALSGPVGLNGGPYLNSQDYGQAVALLRGARPPAKDHFFHLYSIDPKLGAPRAVPTGGPLESVKVTSLEGVWPGKVMRELQRVRAGLYLLPDGLVQVQQDAIGFVRWNQVLHASFGADGTFSTEAGPWNLQLAPQRISEIPRFQGLSQELLRICNLHPNIEDSPALREQVIYTREPNQGVRAPQGARLFLTDPKSPEVWSGPSLHSLGAEPLDPGIHFTQEGLLFVGPTSVEAVRWEDLQAYNLRGNGEGRVFLATTRNRRDFPRDYGNLLPRTLLDAAWKVLPEYWTSDSELTNGHEIGGQARPKRPPEPRRFLLKDYD